MSMEKEKFCSNCRCAFPAWVRTCPNCKTLLIEELPITSETKDNPLSYENLINMVKKNGGRLQIELTTTDVGMEKKWGFPYRGYGFAWAKKMYGTFDTLTVELTTTDVGMEKKWSFPYQGYGFAWAKKMEGFIGGNECILTATKVRMQKKWRIPYLGYGYAWVQEMSGECGSQLTIDFETTDVGKEKKWSFPYQGYGFAWASKGILTITLKS